MADHVVEARSTAPPTLTEQQIASFCAAFQKHFFELGGREREHQHMDDLHRRALASGQESTLDAAMRNYCAGSGQFPPQPGSRYAELNPGADSTAVTWLNRQSAHWAAWQQQPQGERSLPLETMDAMPLAYPPEMWMHHFLQGGAAALDAQARARIASLRDALVVEDALLAGEQFVMRSSIAAAIAEALPEFTGKDLMRRFPELLPEWEAIERARKEIQWRYLRNLEIEFAASR